MPPLPVRLALPFVAPAAFVLATRRWESLVGLLVCVALGWMMLWLRSWRSVIAGAVMIDVLAWLAVGLLFLITSGGD